MYAGDEFYDDDVTSGPAGDGGCADESPNYARAQRRNPSVRICPACGWNIAAPGDRYCTDCGSAPDRSSWAAT